jgi:hypothetical protein
MIASSPSPALRADLVAIGTVPEVEKPLCSRRHDVFGRHADVLPAPYAFCRRVQSKRQEFKAPHTLIVDIEFGE